MKDLQSFVHHLVSRRQQDRLTPREAAELIASHGYVQSFGGPHVIEHWAAASIVAKENGLDEREAWPVVPCITAYCETVKRSGLSQNGFWHETSPGRWVERHDPR